MSTTRFGPSVANAAPVASPMASTARGQRRRTAMGRVWPSTSR
ncbi:MAG TPA: hypothetical protein VG035_05320 [Actinomycetota bacterium]|nr:hypothetical protein [Actinomycetota bacterium]